ncbi:type II secretion system minor pseudopilin GspK [Cupriavidus basilensis]|uniref:Type II secretion system protein K n=1 Tax=Cupriavidus basilensis TaxID=68895 RepID=A0ABT6B2D6_9BURK|nr:type II secretion system minor pseudopilin GspK [Cupriavidus basilensis]MDF3839044.1 type II secretion system minor pseudopilin GspK [Cupriavidus basilensis]
MRRAQRGAAVVTALLIVALATTLVATMFAQQQAATRSVEAHRLRAQGEAMQGIVVERARLLLRDSSRTASVDHLRQRWAQPLPPTRVAALLGPQAARLAGFADSGQAMTIGSRVLDAQARFNLATLIAPAEAGRPASVRASGVALYQRLLTSLSLNSSLASVTAAYVLKSLSGTGGGGQPLPLARMADLLAIPGYTPDAVRALMPYAVILPVPTSVNLNTAGAQVLAAAIPGLTVSQAGALVADRERAHFRDVGDLSIRLKAIAPGLPEPQGLLLETRSQYFLVEGELRNERARLRLEALVRRDGIGEAVRTQVVWSADPATQELE